MRKDFWSHHNEMVRDLSEAQTPTALWIARNRWAKECVSRYVAAFRDTSLSLSERDGRCASAGVLYQSVEDTYAASLSDLGF